MLADKLGSLIGYGDLDDYGCVKNKTGSGSTLRKEEDVES